MIERHYSHLTPRLKKDMLTGKKFDLSQGEYVTLKKIKEERRLLMSTIDYMGIIEEYIPPGLKAYQIEAGRVDLTDYLDELQGQIAEEAEEMGIQKNDLIESMKKQLNVRITEETPNSEYINTLRAIADLVIDRIEQHF